MKSFFRTFLAALLAFFTAIILIVLGIMLNLFFTNSSEVGITANSVLHLDFKNSISERQISSSFKMGTGQLELKKTDGLDKITSQIERAAKDPKISGIFLDFRWVDARYATIEEIRKALTEFKASGKWIVAYSDVLTQKAYYLASVADELYMQPKGMLEYKGLLTKVAFLKNTLSKVGVEMQVIRPENNRFKSAVEPYMLDSMSAANELQTKKLLSGIWNNMNASIGNGRHLTSDQLNALADNLTGADIIESEKAGLITAAKYRDEVEDIILSKLSLDDPEDLKLVSLKDYTKNYGKNKSYLTTKISDNKIAVIYAVGEIGMGEGDESEYQMGSDNLAEAIKEARMDEEVKAVVLRINSPGGGVLASDIIWREMVKTKEVKKVIVSMGDLAASGGYYIATPSDKIFAQENTITGSIGVFGVIPNMQVLNEEILGLSYDEVKTNKHADIFDLTRPMKEEELEKIQKMIDNTYKNFLSIVAESRNMSTAQVDSIAQGRVWVGNDAKNIGLVDEIGGLDDAIQAAVSMVGLDNDYEVVAYPIKEPNPMQDIIDEILDASSQNNIIENELESNPELLRVYKLFHRVNNMKGLQMRMEYELIIE